MSNKYKWLFIAVLILAGDAQAASTISGYPTIGQVTQIDNSGKINIIDLHSDGRGSGSIWAGSDRPLVSPDQKLVAYVRNLNIYVLDISKNKEIAAIEKGKPGDIKYGSVISWIAAWSPDSSKLLYSINIGDDIENVENPSKSKQKREADYGYYIFDLVTKKNEPFGMPAYYRFVSWLDDNRFLLLDSQRKIRADRLFVWNRANDTDDELEQAQYAGYGQIHVAADSKTAVANYQFEVNTSQIVKIDLLTGKTNEITPVGTFAEFQWPKLSPDTKRVAYLKFLKVNKGIMASELYVDSSIVSPNGGRYQWVNNDLVAVTNLCGLEIYNVNDRKRVAYYPELRPTSRIAERIRKEQKINCSKAL